MSKLDAAIAFLTNGTCPVPEDEQDNCQSCTAAIRILEAAAKVDKEKAAIIFSRLCDPDFPQKDRDVLVALFEEVMPLLRTLPDDDGTPGEEGGQRP